MSDLMGLLDIFRRSQPIRDAQALAHFIDRNAAFVVQKGIYEYSRARAGHYAKVLFREPEFQAAAERARWRAYPLGLALVAELVEGILRPVAGEDRQTQADALNALVISVFDRYPPPAAIGEPAWREQRAELAQRLKLISLHPAKRAMDIPEQFAESYFEMMPIHEKLRERDFPTTRNYLRVTMVNIHGELTERIDAEAVAHSLRGC
jgi:hypothetical protein